VKNDVQEKGRIFLLISKLFSNLKYLAEEVQAAASEKVDEVKATASEVASEAKQTAEGKDSKVLKMNCQIDIFI
jgi:hypothetical protein